MMMMLKTLSKIPVIGGVFSIVNAFVWGGNFSSDERFAPISRYMKSLGPATLLALALAAWMIWPIFPSLIQGEHPSLAKLSEFTQKPGQLATSILPNVLGFGIGVYALIFALSAELIKGFHNASQKKNGSTALAINADMAYPLLVLLASIFTGIVQQRFPESARWIGVTWFFLWLSLILTVSLVVTLFRLGEVSVMEKF